MGGHGPEVSVPSGVASASQDASLPGSLSNVVRTGRHPEHHTHHPREKELMHAITAPHVSTRRITNVVGAGLATLAACAMLGTSTADAAHRKDRGPAKTWGPKITATLAADASQDAIDEYFDDEATTLSMKCKKKTRTRALCTAKVTADGDLYLVRTAAKSFYNEDDERDYEGDVLRVRDLGPAPAPAPAPEEPATPTTETDGQAQPGAAPGGNNNNVVVIINGRAF